MGMEEWARVMLKRNEHTGSLPRNSSKIRTHTGKRAALGRLTNGESARRNELKYDGTPYAVKVACTVWSGGKLRDYFKELPITIRATAY